jgi:hypothetical protein
MSNHQLTDDQIASLVGEALAHNLKAKKRRADAKIVKEITDNSDGTSQPSRHSFSDLVQEKTAGLRRQGLERARNELRRRPDIISSNAGEMEFREAYPNVPDEWLSGLIADVRRSRPLG